MAEVTGTSGYITRYEDTTKKASSDNLGKEDFLKLLVAQLTQQDPTNPMKDTEFVSQLATYSGLEQQMNINKNLETLISINQNANISAATACIGKLVGYVDSKGTPRAQLVEFIDIVDGGINLYLTDGSYIPFSKVEQIGIPKVTDGSDESGSNNSDGDGDEDGETGD